MTFIEFRNTLIDKLKSDIERANEAGPKAKTENEEGIYHGYLLHSREMLNLVRDLYVIPIADMDFPSLSQFQKR